MVLAVAQMAEDTKNKAKASKTINLRPQMSDSFAQITPEAAFASRKAAPIQVYPAAELRSREIVGAAVATIVASNAATKSDNYSRSAPA
jgi:hypothetical protein